MEQNLTVLPNKVWNLVRVVYLMLRKGFSKKKLLLEINTMIKRGKIAGKAMFQHHHNNRTDFTSDNHLSFTCPGAAGEYEFSCSNSPSSVTIKHHPFSLFSHNKKHDHDHSNRKLPSKDHLDKMAIGGVDQDNHVDEKAEQFISRFYNDLRRQNTTVSF